MSGDPEVVRRRAWVLGGVCAAGMVAVYVLAVWTTPGQHFEDAVLRAADRATGSTERVHALDTLDQITVPSVVAVTALVLLIGYLRRRPLLGVLSAGMIVVSIITSEVFQRLAPRPILLAHGFRREDQSFPSGHTAVAMSLMCAVVMVAPYRFRGVTVFLTSLGAVGVGVATVTASWHRPSDTIGADLIVTGYACAVVAVLARWGRVREAALRTRLGEVLRGMLAGAYAGVAVLALGVAGVTVGVVLTTAPVRAETDATVLLAGRAIALSGGAAVAVTLMALLRHVDVGAPVVNRAGERESGCPTPAR